MTTATAEKPAEAKREAIAQPKFAMEHQLFPRSYRNHDWRYELSPDVTRADWERGEFWVGMGRKFRPFDRIEVVPMDGSYIATLLVWRCGAGVPEIEVVEYRERKRPDKDRTAGVPGHTIEHNQQDNRYYGRDDATGGIVTPGFATEREAVSELADRVRRLSRR